MKCLDLCSGLGGFSQAFVDAAGWEVMRIENNPLLADVPHTEIMCVKEFRDNLHEMIERGFKPDFVDLVLASPPCLEFSTGFHSPRSIAAREGRLEDYKPDMSILEAVLDIVRMLKPTYFIIENVRGACRYFSEWLGRHKQQITAYYFWGRFPAFTVQNPEDLPTKAELDRGYHHPLRANYRGKIPIEISRAILYEISQQSTLAEYGIFSNV
tara:strand:- start:3209 stop:3844 length:636 start_codon:yes stop_codon:yes gene_type:complete